MTHKEQEAVFIREMDKRIWQLTDELEIDHLFLLGFLQRVQWRIQQDCDFQEMEDAFGLDDDNESMA